MEEQVLGYAPGAVNVGGIARLWLVPIDDVLGMVNPYEEDVPDAFTVPASGLALAVGADVVRLNFPTGAAQFQESRTTGPEGPVYLLTLEARLPDNNAAVLDWAYRNQERDWLAVWLDRNGRAYVGGAPERGLRMDQSRSIADANAMLLSWTGRNWHPAWLLEDADLLTLIPYGRGLYDGNTF